MCLCVILHNYLTFILDREDYPTMKFLVFTPVKNQCGLMFSFDPDEFYPTYIY